MNSYKIIKILAKNKNPVAIVQKIQFISNTSSNFLNLLPLTMIFLNFLLKCAYFKMFNQEKDTLTNETITERGIATPS